MPIEIKGSVSVDTLIVSIGIHLTQSLALPISHLHGRLSWTPKMGQLAKVEPCPQKAPVAQEQDMKRTRKEAQRGVQGEGGAGGGQGGPDDRRAGE